MALTPNVMMDSPQGLITLWVDEAKQDGAIGQVDVVNRRAVRSLTVFALYAGTVVDTGQIPPGGSFTRAFRGNQARAGDVTSVWTD